MSPEHDADPRCGTGGWRIVSAVAIIQKFDGGRVDGSADRLRAFDARRL
jgi:hypothetical protein